MLWLWTEVKLSVKGEGSEAWNEATEERGMVYGS